MQKIYLVLPLFLSLSFVRCANHPASTANKIQCEVGIVGGGPAGVYLAYRLAPQYKDGVCLFEKEAELGGRTRDEAISDAPDSIRVGIGARRVNDTQNFVLGLAHELGIEFEVPEKRSQRIQYKGKYYYSSDALLPFFPRVIKSTDNDPSTTREDEIYTLLLAKENVAKSHKYPKMRDYITAVAGLDAVAFLRASSRFHGDFDNDLSTPNFLGYLQFENPLSTVNRYPIGGMSMFVRKMEAAALRHHVRFFKSEPVLELNTEHPNYVIRTAQRQAIVHRLVLAAPPSGINWINGDVAAEIRNAPEYKSLLPVRIVVINQVWQQPWWNDVRNPNGKGEEAKTWRAWSSDHCVNHTEIPQEKYIGGKVTRSVYTEDPACVKFWEKQFAKGGITKVETETIKGLSSLFHVQVPKPVRTTMHVWPAGWYYVRVGSNISNQRIIDWALHPIANQENLMLVGEVYWPNRPGWSEGAYFSVNNLLDAKFKDVKHPH